jgi:DNA-binding NtrC family response regulator
MAARILVVEASHDMRVLISDVLTTDGHEVKCAANGADALVLLEQQSTFDLILGDLTIPAIEGAHLYWEVGRRWPELASRLICVTDGHDAGVIDHATLRVASVPFLVKPFLPQQLRDLVGRRLADEGGTRGAGP